MTESYNGFKLEIDPVIDIYRQDNSWVGDWDPSWNDDDVMEMFIKSAYLLYRVTSKNELKLTVLGGTGVRMFKELLLNFGVTGATGIQDDETALAFKKKKPGLWNRMFCKSRLPQRPSANQVAGAILSEKNWTPLLNDALIIGAIRSGQQFHIALEQNERALFAECRDDLMKAERRRMIQENYTLVEAHRELGRLSLNRDYQKKLWRMFLNRNHSMLWDANKNNPRVLARELLGLSFFGYQPVFDYDTLKFKPPRHAVNPAFNAYAYGLRNLKFHDSSARRNIMETLSDFLFHDKRAVVYPGDERFHTSQAA